MATVGYSTPWGTTTLPARSDEKIYWTLAVSDEGRRTRGAPLASDEALALAAGRDDVVIVLDHAGAEASRWREARSVAATDEPSKATGRRPRALDDDGWRAVIADFADAARRARAHGAAHVVIGAVDDGLLHGAARTVDVVRACAAHLQVGLALPVEDLAPRRMDATAGVALGVFAEAAGASRFIVRAGTAAFRQLRDRPKPQADDEPWMASAMWLLGRVRSPVYAAGPLFDRGRALAIAERAGLAGVIAWEVEGASTR